MPEGRIQILTHHTEHTVWQPRWLTHPNGALGLASMTIVVADVGEAAGRFARFCGRAATPSPSGQSIALDRGRVELVGADAFARMLPQIPIPSVPFMGTYSIRVRSLSATRTILVGVGSQRVRWARIFSRASPRSWGKGRGYSRSGDRPVDSRRMRRYWHDANRPWLCSTFERC